ncbi:MAG: NUDIX domain-containing protein [Planctomycetota bacterium]
MATSDQHDGPRKKGKKKVTRERSAGVVVYCDRGGRREFLLLDYGRHWDYAKGHLEAGEDDRTAALRELREETGLSEGVELLEGFEKMILYHFNSSRKGLVRKEVLFFVGKLDPDKADEVMLSEEHVGYEWLEREPALQRLTFDNAKGVLAAADNFAAEHDPLTE